MLSIFATRKQATAWAEGINVGKEKHDRVGIPQRPLKVNTQKRLAGGLLKWVLDAAEPFIVNIENYGWNSSAAGHSVSEPLSTVTAGPKGGKHAAVDVDLAAFNGTFNHGGNNYRTNDLRQPMGTIVGANEARGVVGAELAPFSIPRYGEREGQAPRSRSLEAPAPTITPTDNGAQLAAVALNKHNLGVIGQGVDQPIGTVTGIDHHSLLAVHLTNYHGAKGGEVRGQSIDESIRTLDTENRFGAVATHLVKFRGDSVGNSLSDPMPTVTSGAGAARDAGAAHAMGVAEYRLQSSTSQQAPAGLQFRPAEAAAFLSHMYTSNTCGGQGDPRQPLKCITSGGQHSGICVVYLSPFYGEGSGKTGHTPAAPMPTCVGNDRFALGAVETSRHWIMTPAALRRAKQVATWARRMLGSKVQKHLLKVLDDSTGKAFYLLKVAVKGAVHLVTDILMRMLRPRELARAQGFDDSYIIDRTSDGRRISKADQVKLIGNSVPPVFPRAIVKANVVDMGLLDDAPELAGEAVCA
jgi:DNA (cytosine-5)-methyltransferase 1